MRLARPLAGLGLALGLALPLAGAAHEVRPGYLQLREVDAEHFDVLWKVPARGALRLALEVELPASCSDVAPRARFPTGGAVMERWRARCEGGLVGRQIGIDGLEATLTDVLVRIEHLDGSTQVERLLPSAPRFVVAAAPRAGDIARTYLGLGIEHIALGVDHLLFVLGLLLLVEGGRRLVGTITAFTLAHSATLAAATLGWLPLAPQPVEAVIALSIVFVAVEIVHEHEGRAGLARRWPWAVAAGFGLLHGFGFAGALREAGLPPHAIPLALLFFNVGVELAQLGAIALALPVLGLLRRTLAPRLPWAWRVPATAIGATAAYWTIERVAGLLA